MAFPNLEYCKTDLVCKGVVFLKFSLSSSALLALEAITEQGTVGVGVRGRRAPCALGPALGREQWHGVGGMSKVVCTFGRPWR